MKLSITQNNSTNVIFGFIQKHAILLLLIAYALAGVLTIIFFDGTGDDGDSIAHYLFAKYAPVHPSLFFNHWAKPLFVLISSPFTKFGFSGMKFFNLLVSILMFLLTYRTALLLRVNNALLVVVFLIFTPLYYVLTFSGLTEPLFALFLIGAIYLILQKEYITAAIMVSLLPFVRSEGLLIIPVFGLYFLLTKQWKYLIWLGTGHVVFAIAGYFVYHDLLWVFTRIPYAGLDHKYGSGSILHFVFQLNYVIGVPVYFLLVVGLISYGVKMVRKNEKVSIEELTLVVSGFLVFFLAHTVFWYQGIFHSMGLKRVLLSVIPLIAIIALRGFNHLTGLFDGKLKYFRELTAAVLIVFLVVFPFTHNPAAINWKKDLQLTPAQNMSKGVAAFFKERPIPPGAKILYFYPYLSEALNIDHFDSLRRVDLSINELQSLKKDDLVIWDNWFSLVEAHVTLDMLMKKPGMKRLIDFSSQAENQQLRFVIFRQD